MKKVLCFILVLVMCLSMCACSGGQSGGASDIPIEKSENSINTSEQPKEIDDTNVPSQEENIHYYKLGETVSTDIFEFTLNAAEFCIALNNVNDDNRYTPKEYDPQDDANNPYVAPMGHTFAAFSYTVNNLNRTSCEVHDGNSVFATVKYDGNNYSSMKDGAYFLYADKTILDNGNTKTEKAGKWYNNPGSNFLLMTGAKETRRARIDIDTNITDLTADVEITFAIPNSDGSKTEFTYLVSEANRTTNTNSEIEMSLELALISFTKNEGQTYFSNHIAEYPVVSGDEMINILSGKWTIDYIIADVGHWSGHFLFEDDGKIKDDYGYINERTWAVDGDTVIIDGETVCEMRKVADYVYLLIYNDSPYLLMQK